MRFLCLHGKGTSASIFESQISSFRALLPQSYTFTFLNAPHLSTPAPGIELFYPPPYYSFYDLPSLSSLRSSHDWLLTHLSTSEPYDGVLCFSQGCALISSLLLYHQKIKPDAKPLFKVAVFICGGVPLDVLEDLGVEVTSEAREWDESSKRSLMERAGTEAILREGSGRWGVGFDSLSLSFSSSSYVSSGNEKKNESQNEIEIGNKEEGRNIFGIDFSRVGKEKLIQIPTVHVFGNRDPRFPASITLANFCEKGLRRTFDHGGGHDIPRKRDVSVMLAELIEWCGMMAERW